VSADTHVSVLLTEAVTGLAIPAGGDLCRCHLRPRRPQSGDSGCAGPGGRLIALDRDPAAIAAGAALSDPRFTLVHAAFSEFDAVLDGLDIARVDGVLLDIGVSSPQLNTPERGMSFRFDAPLDMRMDTTQGETAAEFLARASQSELEKVIKDYGEERFAHAIAKALVAARGEHGISSTGQLATLVAQVVRTREPGQHPATRSFQALRIHVNRELEELSLVLPRTVERLVPGGRLAVICFHSLEDRIVKRFLRDAAQSAATTAQGRAGARRRPAAADAQAGGQGDLSLGRRSRRQPALSQRGAACGGEAIMKGAHGAAQSLLVLVAVACALSAVSSNHRARKLFTELEATQKRMRDLEVEWGQLQLEQSTLAAHVRVEKLRARKARHEAAGPGQIIAVDAAAKVSTR
jgi:16S rRNA (cytosine1402-N4)-methyltransferase